jgi:hypothetical protein
VDGGVTVFSDDALADQDRVLEVITIPWHERDQHVLAQCQLAQIGGGAVSDDITFGQSVAFFDNRPLVDVCVLIGTLVFDQVVDVNAHFTRLCFGVVDPDNNPGGIDIVDQAATGGGYHSTGVHRRNTLDTGSDKGFFGPQNRHSLALHVGTHQSAIGVVVL